MTAFIKAEFTPGEYASYSGKFVARFKRGGRASFLTFLCKNFQVEEYFSRLESGESPLKILESKGYVSPAVAKLLKQQGYPVTRAGADQMLADTIKKYTRV